MITLQFITCVKCKESYLVGMDGKDIRKAQTSGGEMDDGTPYMAIGNEDIPDKKIPRTAPCPKCGASCEVTTSEGSAK